MPNTIVFNSSNIVGNDNNTLVYNFPSSVKFDNHSIAVESVSINYSWYNISAALDNNSFTYTWWNITANAWVTYTVTIEDGLYELSDINARLQFEMVKNGHYLINALGQNVYYVELAVNATRYAFQLNTFPLPTAAQFAPGVSNPTTGTGTGYVDWKTPVADSRAGTSAWNGFPANNYNPVVTFPATNNFYKLMGFVAGFASPQNNSNLNYSALSTASPVIQENTNVFLSLSNIDNKYANPTSIVHNLVVSGPFGGTILDRPNNLAYNTLVRGQYNQLRIQILGSNLRLLEVNDPDIVIVMIIDENK